MRQEFLTHLEENNLFTPESRVLIALSGGVDSVALTDLMMSLPDDIRPEIELAHVNHQLRDVSDWEQQLVEKIAARYGVPLHTYIWPTAEHPTSGTEQAARNMRYAFFTEVMVSQQLDTLLTAHHADDQVETILMRLVRGSALELLTGIDAVSYRDGYRVVRPLLAFRKNDLYAYAHRHQLSYAEDATNQQSIYTRNRMRLDIIPELRQLNPQFDEGVLDLAIELADTLVVRQKLATQLVKQLVTEKDGRFILSRTSLQQLAPAERRVLLNELLRRIYAEEAHPFKNRYVPLLDELVKTGNVGQRLDFSDGVEARLTYDYLVLGQQAPVSDSKSITEKAVQITAEHLAAARQQTAWLRLAPGERLGVFLEQADLPPVVDRDVLVVPKKNVVLPLTVRHRQPGDAMQVAGMQGTKKINRLFIDEKIPQDIRDEQWLVQDANGQIIWLVGLRKGEGFNDPTLSPSADAVFYLVYERISKKTNDH